MANKNVLKAQRKVAKALSAFNSAHAAIGQVEALLEEDIAATSEAINELIAERLEATEQLERTAEVKAKLAEFVI